MRFGRTSRAIGIAAASALALSACASSGGEDTSTESGEAGTGSGSSDSISVAEVNAFSSFNSETATGFVDINSKVSYLTHSDFFHVDSELNVVPNEAFGTYEKISGDPLTVKYTVNEGVAWSDGNPVDAGDLLLAWAVGSGHYDDATYINEREIEDGTAYFAFAGDTSGLGLTDKPEIGDAGRSITLTYAEPFVDWEVAYGVLDTPAHVVAEMAGLADEQALVDLLNESEEGDPENPVENEELQAVADAWNTGFDTKTLPEDSSLFLSNGPYIVESITPEQSMTLVRNEDYTWGPVPTVEEITIRYIGAAPDQVQALENGEVDIIAPQPSADTVQLLEDLDDVVVERGPLLAYEHIDLNYTGVFADASVREAFMKAVPRQAIVDRLVGPLDPEAAPLDSQFFVPAQAPYEESAANNGSENYQEADIEAARELLGGATPEVTILYNRDNPNRIDTFALIQESAEQAGFRIVDGGLGGSDWGDALDSGNHDAVIFGWTSGGVGVSGVPQIFYTGADANYNGFSDAEADALMDELILTTDRAEQQELIIDIDEIVWDSFYGLPLYQSVGISAYNSSRVEGVAFTPTQVGVWWNFWEWKVK